MKREGESRRENETRGKCSPSPPPPIERNNCEKVFNNSISITVNSFASIFQEIIWYQKKVLKIYRRQCTCSSRLHVQYVMSRKSSLGTCR